MRILHISTLDNDGAGQCCLRIHCSMLDAGIESKVVVLQNTKHVKGEYGYGEFIDKIKKIPTKLFSIMGLRVTERNRLYHLSQIYHAPYSLPTSNVNLLNNKWIEWADIIHLHWVCNYIDYPSFFKNIDKPIVWTLHDEYFFYGIAHYSNHVLKNNQIEIHYAQVKYKALSNVKSLSVVLLSDFLYQKYKGNNLLKNRRVKVINNSVDAKTFVPISKFAARRELGLNDDDVVFAFTAMIIDEKRKGLDLLSQTLMEINPKIKILAIGNNPQNRFWPNVICVGPKKNSREICKVLSAADYYAMPSSQEAFAQSPMEAMACGLPVVVFPVSGTSELIRDYNGVVCEDFTKEALDKGIQELMKREYDSMEIREDMIARFSPESIASDYIELYREIM